MNSQIIVSEVSEEQVQERWKALQKRLAKSSDRAKAILSVVVTPVEISLTASGKKYVVQKTQVTYLIWSADGGPCRYWKPDVTYAMLQEVIAAVGAASKE